MNQDYIDALAYVTKHASKYGLEWECESSFKLSVKSSEKHKCDRLSREEYFEEANHALLEWDI